MCEFWTRSHFGTLFPLNICETTRWKPTIPWVIKRNYSTAETINRAFISYLVWLKYSTACRNTYKYACNALQNPVGRIKVNIIPYVLLWIHVLSQRSFSTNRLCKLFWSLIYLHLCVIKLREQKTHQSNGEKYISVSVGQRLLNLISGKLSARTSSAQGRRYISQLFLLIQYNNS